MAKITLTMSKKSIYKHKKYWYHVSTTLKKKYVNLIPRDEHRSPNRDWKEPDGKRISVAPTIEQCITALPYHLSVTFTIYRTKNYVRANPPKNVFDSKITQEGWLYEPTPFLRIGTLKFSDLEKGLGVMQIIEQSASLSEPRRSGKVLKWWKKAKIKRFVKIS